MTDLKTMFNICGRVAVITGGAGLLGTQHAEAIAEGGGIPVLVDKNGQQLDAALARFKEKFGGHEIMGLIMDITKKEDVERMTKEIIGRYGKIDILINNATNNPQMEKVKDNQWSRFENFPIEIWRADLEVGLTGSFLCSQAIGREMVRKHKGVIVNIASDLGLIAPDQRIYRLPGMTEEDQPFKPATYSAIKGGLIVLTKYLATYWAKDNIRVNTLTPASVYNNQDPSFVENISRLIPMGRMSYKHEFKAALLFLVSDASSYMTGSNLVIDGGRTAW